MINVKFKTGFNEALLFDQICRLIKSYNGKNKLTIKSILECRIEDLKSTSDQTEFKDVKTAIEIYHDLIEILEISDIQIQINSKEFPKQPLKNMEEILINRREENSKTKEKVKEEYEC